VSADENTRYSTSDTEVGRYRAFENALAEIKVQERMTKKEVARVFGETAIVRSKVMRNILLVVTLLATPVAGADPFLFLEDRGEPEGWLIPPGAHTYDLMVDTQGMDWSMATMIFDIEAGEVWQFPLGWDGPPNPCAFSEWPSLEWDSFVTFPEAYPNTLSNLFFGFIVAGSFESATTGERAIMWVDLTTNQDGPYTLARLTVTEDFVGRIDGTVWFSETGWDQYPFSFWIPEPGTLAGLIPLAALAARRARVALAPCGQRGS
jgi:hypothetical protein